VPIEQHLLTERLLPLIPQADHQLCNAGGSLVFDPFCGGIEKYASPII
jgi:hypothetical protein